MNYLMLPGIGGSDRDHWQSRWEDGNPCFNRFCPESWAAPELENWLAALEERVICHPEPPILVAHSLACLLVAHWAARTRCRAAGAFLVSVPDPVGPNFPAVARSFAAPPSDPLPFPSLIVASEDDPYGSPVYAQRRAEEWDAGLVEVGAFGHLNSLSGLGDWPEGRRLLTAFEAGIRPKG